MGKVEADILHVHADKTKERSLYTLSDGGEEDILDSTSAYSRSTLPRYVLFQPAQSTFADARYKLPILLYN